MEGQVSTSPAPSLWEGWIFYPLGVALLFLAPAALTSFVFRRRSYLGDAEAAPLGLLTVREEKSSEQTTDDELERMPPCYSTPDADPSEGEWRSSANGVDDSPVDMVNWLFPHGQFDFLKKCQNIWNRDHRDAKKPRPYWAWEPTKCSLHAINEASFCQVMEGRIGLLFVGDSLTRLSTTTLASILRARSVNADLMQDDWEACGGKLKLRFMRNDVLDVRTEPRYRSVQCEEEDQGPVMEGTRCRLFATDNTLSEFDTLVVNSGAHPRPIDQYGREMETAAEALTASMTRLHGQGKAVLVVRNTIPGHWGCTDRMFDGPVDANVAAELVNASPKSFEWKSFHDRNVLLEKAFSPDRGWRLLDAYSPTLLRPDTHIGGKDCLHYCVPGPADHWIVLLYNILLAFKGGSQASEIGH